MTHQVQLNDQEYQVVLQLLEAERGDLHPEVRRSTMNVQAHEELQDRLKMVESLIERLQKAPSC
jgi:ppGpp synthetase/RelA/SpoT-type nucleotidyltranferase